MTPVNSQRRLVKYLGDQILGEEPAVARICSLSDQAIGAALTDQELAP